MALSKRRGYIAVVAVLPGSPAAEAGIRSRDLLITIDGRPSREMGIWEANEALRGAQGSEVSIFLDPVDGGDRRTEKLQRSAVLCAGISLVRCKPIPGKIFGDASHHRIAGHLGNYRGCSDAQ